MRMLSSERNKEDVKTEHLQQWHPLFILWESLKQVLWPWLV